MGQQYFNVEVEGDYFRYVSGGESIRRFGPVKIKMIDWNHAQMFCRVHLLPELIKKIDLQFSQMRRCFVLGITTPNGVPVEGLPIDFQSREQITRQCQQQDIHLVPAMYPEIDKLRNRFKYALHNRKEFNKQENKSKRAFSKITETMALNQSLFDALSTPIVQDTDGTPATEGTVAKIIPQKSGPPHVEVDADIAGSLPHVELLDHGYNEDVDNLRF